MTTLLTISHDPQGKLLKPLKSKLPLIVDLFANTILVITQKTNPDYHKLQNNNFHIYELPQLGMANARRDAVNLALAHIKDNHYFYCDLDRLLWWAIHYPDELRDVRTEVVGREYTVIGRKYLAMQSHPQFQLKTEEIMNLIVKEKAELDMDVFAGAKAFNARVANWISEQSTSQDAAQDIEWPLIVKENRGMIRYIEVNGLGYESAFLDIEKTRQREFSLRMKNLKSVMEFLNG